MAGSMRRAGAVGGLAGKVKGIFTTARTRREGKKGAQSPKREGKHYRQLEKKEGGAESDDKE